MRAKHRELASAALEMVAKGELQVDPPLPSRDVLRSSSGEELDEHQTEFMFERRVSESIHVYTQPVYWSVAADIPNTYVVNLLDRSVPLELQRTMAARLPCRPTMIEIESGHLPMVVRPQVLASLIDDVVATVDP